MRPMHATAMILVLLIGCGPSHVSPSSMQRTELFFGLSRADGGLVSDPEWQAFVDDTITPRFPEGFTILDGAGQWRDSSGRIAHEQSKILLILHPRDQMTVAKIDQIRAAYKQRFNQDAVIRESSDVTVSF